MKQTSRFCSIFSVFPVQNLDSVNNSKKAKSAAAVAAAAVLGGNPSGGGSIGDNPSSGGGVSESDKPRRYACLVCGKAFVTPSKLQRHSFTHSGMRPFQCNVCGKSFSQSANLKTHVRNTHPECVDEQGNPRPEFIHNAVPEFLKEQLVAQSASLMKSVEAGNIKLEGNPGLGAAAAAQLQQQAVEQAIAQQAAAAAAAASALAAVDGDRSAGNTAIVMPESPVGLGEGEDGSGDDEELDDDEEGSMHIDENAEIDDEPAAAPSAPGNVGTHVSVAASSAD